jgi:hypothetical protein
MVESPERGAVRRGLDQLKPFLTSYIATHSGHSAKSDRRDMAALLRTIVKEWDAVYSHQLPRVVRSYIYELIDVRNRWAHEEPFSKSDMARALSTISQVAGAIGAPSSTSVKARTPALGKKLSQRDVMRDIYARNRGREERIIAEYAEAERTGTVERIGNKSGHTPEQYAAALLNDGLKKGWLR